jgi:hypothetical protein
MDRVGYNLIVAINSFPGGRMRKFLINQMPHEPFNKCRYYLLAIPLFTLLLSACQVQSNPEVAQTVEVEIVPATTPSPTPACTPPLPGMSVTVHPLVNHQMIIQLKGFKPGEKVDITGNTLYDGNGRGFEIFDQKIEPDGSAYDREGSSAETGAAINHWHFQVTYSSGVTCTDIDILP